MGVLINGVKQGKPVINGVKMNAIFNGQKIWGDDAVIGKFVALGYSATSYWSTDGINWTPIDTAQLPSASRYGIAYSTELPNT
jgi:hypothetical protein